MYLNPGEFRNNSKGNRLEKIAPSLILQFGVLNSMQYVCIILAYSSKTNKNINTILYANSVVIHRWSTFEFCKHLLNRFRCVTKSYFFWNISALWQ